MSEGLAELRDRVSELEAFAAQAHGPEAWESLKARCAALEKERDEAVTALREEREGFGMLTRDREQAMCERDAALADNAAKEEAFARYVYEHGVEHDDSCPEDDTCECSLVVALNKAFGAGSPGAALLEEHRKALVRARNEGLEKAAAWHDGQAASQGFSALSSAPFHRRYGAVIRAMKEPES